MHSRLDFQVSAKLLYFTTFFYRKKFKRKVLYKTGIQIPVFGQTGLAFPYTHAHPARVKRVLYLMCGKTFGRRTICMYIPHLRGTTSLYVDERTLFEHLEFVYTTRRRFYIHAARAHAHARPRFPALPHNSASTIKLVLAVVGACARNYMDDHPRQVEHTHKSCCSAHTHAHLPSL